MTFVDYFKEHFYEKLLTPATGNPIRNRADSLLKVFELLEEKYPFDSKRMTQIAEHSVAIVESGTARRDHGDLSFGDDGASTFIFHQYIKFRNRGKLHSVDISKENCNYAKELTNDSRWATSIHCGDSVKFLNSLPKEYKISLLYLDSMDVYKDRWHESSAHHLMELCASMKNITSDTIIIVDDYDAFFDGGKTGKGVYIKEFVDKIGATILFQGYQLVFQIP